MCKSKTQGGQRCAPHARNQLSRAHAAHTKAEAKFAAAQAAHAAAVKSGDAAATKRAAAQVTQKKAARGRTSTRVYDAQTMYASTPTGRKIMMQEVRDLKEAGDRDGAAEHLSVVRQGIYQNQDAKAQYKEWRETQPKGGSMKVRREDDVKVAYATGKGEPSPLPEGVTTGRSASESLAAPGPTRKEPPTVDEDVAAHRSVSGAYDDYSERVGRVEERMVKHLKARSGNTARGYSTWKDERTGQGVELRGGQAYSDWNKEEVDAKLTARISTQTGTDPETTQKLISDYQDVASVKGYRAHTLRHGYGIDPAKHSTATPKPQVAVARNASPTVEPNENTTHEVLTNGPRHYAAMNASVDAVEANWDTMDDDEKIRSYVSLQEGASNLRAARDSIVDRVADKVAKNPSATYGKDWGVKTSDRPYTKFPDMQGTHDEIRTRIASDHAKAGGDGAQAREVLDLYGEAAQFNNPKKGGMTARGMDPDAHSISVYGKPKMVYADQAEERRAS